MHAYPEGRDTSGQSVPPQVNRKFKKRTFTMTMKPEDFRRALEIITRNNRITVSFNTPVDNNYANTYPLLIHESNATVLKQLHDEGYSLSMTEKGLCVMKY